MNNLPSAPVPSDCDLQDFAFMPLHVARLRDSDLAAEEDPEACWYAVLLWSASWHQIPAASLPDNDTVLCKLIGLGRDLRTFRKHRDGMLRGFIKCDDGRLYHPVVVEQALDAWKSKLEQRWRTECARVRKSNQRNNLDDPQPTFEEFVSRDWPQSVTFMSQGQGADVPRDKVGLSHGTGPEKSRDIASKGQGQGQGQGNNKPPTPLRPVAEKKGEYVFEGQTIRLSRRHFDQWAASYHAIPDLRAELQSLDDWLQGENVTDAKRKDWFQIVSRSLGRKHEERLATRREEDTAHAAFLARYPEQVRTESDWRAVMGDEEFEAKRHRLKIADEPERKVAVR